MQKTKVSRKTMKPAVIPVTGARHGRGVGQTATQKEVRDYVAAMAAELAELSVTAGLDALAVSCDVVREIAQGNVNSQSRQVEFLPVFRRN